MSSKVTLLEVVKDKVEKILKEARDNMEKMEEYEDE